MRGDRMPARVLAMRLIPRVDAGLRDRLGLGAEVHALGLITCDSDDVGYTALDEATKKACVSVAYAQSMYAGAANANTALAGEFLGILYLVLFNSHPHKEDDLIYSVISSKLTPFSTHILTRRMTRLLDYRAVGIYFQLTSSQGG